MLRCVPRVDREEFVNVGVVLYCQATDFLEAAWHVDRERLRALDPRLDLDAGLRRPWPFVEGVLRAATSAVGAPRRGKPAGTSASASSRPRAARSSSPARCTAA